MRSSPPEQPPRSRGRSVPAPVLFASPQITASDIDAVTAVLRSGWITTGDECAALEAELAGYLGARDVVAVSSCTAALEIVLAGQRLPPGARVGLPAWTFISTALAAVHNGLRPVLLDVDPDTLNISAQALESALDAGLEAVIGVHFGGVPIAAEIHELCAAHRTPLIEDAAHALGAADHRGPIGRSGSACFSFYATKNLTCAEGGAIATDDPSLAEFARLYRSHGMSADAWARYAPNGAVSYDMTEAGIKANLPDLLAALARSQLKRFDDMQSRRRKITREYRRLLEPLGLRFVPSEWVDGSADHLSVVVLPSRCDRPSVISALKQQGVHPSVHFRPLHHFTWFARNAEVGPGGLPVCDALADRVLSLPLHVGLTDHDVRRVVEALESSLADD